MNKEEISKEDKRERSSPIKPLIVATFSSKGGCSKTTIIANLYELLIKRGSGFKNEKIALLNSATETNSISALLKTYYTYKIQEYFNKGVITEKEAHQHISDIEKQVENNVVTCSKKDLVTFLKRSKSIQITMKNIDERLANQQIILVDFDGGSLDIEDIEILSSTIDLWIIPCVPTATANEANDNILNNLLKGRVEGKKIIQLIVHTKPDITPFILEPVRTFVKEWGHKLINFIDLEIQYDKLADIKVIWGIQKSKKQNTKVFIRILDHCISMFNEKNPKYKIQSILKI